ncbi:hypothetical protein [Pedobacter caeni]|uniref:Uncharacterized protein n=1 Tax=Pedobacter caeni TaxID=288992 RepID=A0A1M5BD03_9SPHI|nr:hypothetical protein [Pedobacter caeni]SHF40187.1 hypothetical protein SAMN04488522_1021133 [Pedobacter caeni]
MAGSSLVAATTFSIFTIMTRLFIISILLLLCATVPINLVAQTSPKKNNSVRINGQFRYADFKIKRGQLGKIKIGMTVREAEQKFSGLTRKTDEAGNFGFDGGGPAYLYYSGKKVVLGLIPKMDTDTIMCIIAADKRLYTTNRLNPNSSVKDLLKKYPRMKVYWDEMNGWEFFQDHKNNWNFVFMTDEKSRIGSYPDLNVPSRPERTTAKTDWITIL